MKMHMPLIAAEDGIAQFVKQPGASLNPGDIVGILTLDDPARVKHAKPFDGLLPVVGTPNVIGNKPDQLYLHYIDILNNIIDGYDNQSVMQSTLKDLTAILEDPSLPYSEIYAVLSTLSGRIPAKLEEQLRVTIDAAKAKNAEFPTSRVKKGLDAWLAETRPQDRTAMRAQLSPLFDIADRYRAGLKSAQWSTIVNLLSRYLDTEKLFGEHGSIEERVLKLREENKDNLGRVAALVLSHIRTQGKNKLMLALLEIVKAGGSSVAALEPRMSHVIKGLASLESRCVFYAPSRSLRRVFGIHFNLTPIFRSTTPVSLKAREVLIASQLPSYEERSVQMEQVLKSAVSANTYGETRVELR
jgi:acetyl-CoA carboxylase/biotin carboxylase 1